MVEREPSRDPRRALGSRGEDLAVAHLRRAGYEVLDRNFRCRHGELDVVARHGPSLVFCEVKARVAGGLTGPATPLEAIGHAKRRRLRRLAAEWLRSRGDRADGAPNLRFDAIGVTVDAAGTLLRLDHVEEAF